MTIKPSYLIAILLLLATTGGGIAYFVIFNQSRPVASQPQGSGDLFAPKERLPTEGGQEMKPRF